MHRGSATGCGNALVCSAVATGDVVRKKVGGCSRDGLDEKNPRPASCAEKSRRLTQRCRLFSPSNKSRLYAMKTFILRDSCLTNWEGRPIFPPFRPPRGALLREAFEGWDGMRY